MLIVGRGSLASSMTVGFALRRDDTSMAELSYYCLRVFVMPVCGPYWQTPEHGMGRVPLGMGREPHSTEEVRSRRRPRRTTTVLPEPHMRVGLVAYPTFSLES